MMRNILIGLGAGLAASFLFAGLVSGTALAFPLFMLSPLPIAIAGIGFGTLSGIAAAGLSATLIGAVLGPIAGLLYLLAFGAPTAWAAHWIGLSRPSEAGSDGREWFPLSQVLFRLALFVGVSVVIVGFVLGFDPAALVDQTATMLESWLAQGVPAADAPTREQIEPLVRFNILLMPATSTAMSLGINILNTWMAARIVRVSGQLQRPWTPAWAIVLPPLAAPLFGIALVAAFLPGAAGHVAAALAGAIGFAFSLTGFGCLHAYLQGKPGKPLVLFVAYALSFVFVLPIVVMAAVGVADTLMQFRARRLAERARPS